MSEETLYGRGLDPPPPLASSTPAGSTGAASDNNAVMNDKVQALAGAIYEEFERMMAKYDASVVKDLMPLIVNVLESLDLAYTESQELEVEAELLKEDNEQLVTQYEREKQLRKAAENRLIEIDDLYEGEKKETAVKIESLTSIIKMFELKAKNSQDQISRLDDKESEMKREYTKLHDRYTDLFKTHIDYMERTKSVLGAERVEQLGANRNKIPQSLAVNQQNNRSSGPVSFGYSELENNNSQSGQQSLLSPEYPSPGESGAANTTLKNELKSPGAQSSRKNDKGRLGGWMDGVTPDAEIVDLEVEEAEDISEDKSIGPATPISHHPPGHSHTKNETRTGNTLYQELSFQDAEAIGDVDEGADITDNESENGEFRDKYGFDNGMGKEVDNLITENNELLATKNALNIVKDDLIAKVDELTGEHEILREEIKSLQAIRSRLETKVKELEDEIKANKEEAEKAAKATKPEEEEDVPLAQRKRFTRVEMARVLMERNQYKERFMELQEAVRWTEMIRASKTTDHPGGGAIEKKGQKGIWKFFGNLFSGSIDQQRPPDPMVGAVNMRYNTSSDPAEEAEVSPALTTMRAKVSAERKTSGGSKTDAASEADNGASERKEQYKQVRAHVKKEDGRMQAYGWSLPAKQPGGAQQQQGVATEVQSRVSSSGVPVPVPVYCRPLMEKEPGMKIWCAAGVTLNGGRTKDGGDIVGASVFYNKENEEDDNDDNDDNVKKLDKELKESKKVADEGQDAEKNLSSHVWICTSTHAISKVTVIDANSPADVLESFQVCSSHLLCIASVPGAMETDYKVDQELNRLVVEESEKRSQDARDNAAAEKSKSVSKSDDIRPEEIPGGGGIGSISFVSCAIGHEEQPENKSIDSLEKEMEEKETAPRLTRETAEEPGSKSALNRTLDVFKLQELSDDPDPHATLPFISHHTLNISRELPPESGQGKTKSPEDKPPSESPVNPDTADAVHRRFSRSQQDPKVLDGINQPNQESTSRLAYSEMEKMSSVLPTMWLGSQSGSIYVHSSVAQWKRCIHAIRLRDSVLSIVHVKGRVFAALANGSIAIFHRRPEDGQWDLTNYHLLDLGRPNNSIRCMVQVHNKVWCGYRNRIFSIDVRTMTVTATFDAHPRRESQVRQLAWVGDGVWVSIRLDSTLRLYHAHTNQHLQDVDIEPYVSKMLGTGKLGFSFVRITALLVSNYRLWMGTGNGVIISVPLNQAGKNTLEGDQSQQSLMEAMEKAETQSPSTLPTIYTDDSDSIHPETFVPYCNMANAQLSFHGHRDAVKFFVSVPGHGGLALNPTSSPSKSVKTPSDCQDASSMLVMSGGEGYIDFRIGEVESDDEPRGLSTGEKSHLIVWQVPILGKKKL